MNRLKCLLPLLVLICLCTTVSGLRADDTVYTKVDENPIPLKTPPPVYPPALRRDKITGVVAVLIVIDETGTVVSEKISKSTQQEFEEPALEAVKNWKFRPAKKDGNAVKVKLMIPIRFNFEEQ